MSLNPEFKSLIKDARKVAVFTGAGVSRESGIATFRGPGGLWTRTPPKFIASPEAYAENPRRLWRFHERRRVLCRRAQPNRTHYIIAEMERYYPEFILITQNVDNLHKRAGSERIVELHGSLEEYRCLDCSRVQRHESAGPLMDIPQCRSCGAFVRPNVLWFGEAYDRAVTDSLREYFLDVDLIFVLGYSAATRLPNALIVRGLKRGAKMIKINIEWNILAVMADLFIEGPSGEEMPAMWRHAMGRSA